MGTFVGNAQEAGAEEIDLGAGRGRQAVQVDTRAGGIAFVGAEGVVEDALDGRGGGLVGVEG